MSDLTTQFSLYQIDSEKVIDEFFLCEARREGRLKIFTGWRLLCAVCTPQFYRKDLILWI